jgi:tetratricopeptide (TPR) repeat protein
MELVKGVPITEFCDQNRLAPRQRLELFRAVCQAVQHAHQKGIIHRDLKPSNVLVSRHDTTPVVKVIDFGVAKALGQGLTDKTLCTGFAQMIGTPLYMSPEQAGMSDLDVDTRSDIYSLGMLLYELLTGTTPFDKERFRQAGYDEMRRIIREEEPPRPSTRLSTLGQAATTISAQRQSDPKRLRQLVRGELDWIVMKCLEKDRNRRYETASALAADIQHYLHDEPVQACPPSAWYRVGKFARRQKRALAMAACVVLAVAGLAGGVGWAARDRAARQEAGARQAEEAVTAARAFFGENRLDGARRKLAEARALLAAHHVALGSLAGEIGALEAELARFEQFFALIDQARQAEIASPAEVAPPGESTDGTTSVLSRKLGQEREPARAVPFLRKALALYKVLGQKDWSAALGRGALGRDQVEQVRRAAYEELLWLADDILARREDHVSGERLSAPAAARQALAYLDRTEAAHRPTRGYFWLRARSRRALGDKEAVAGDARLFRATPPTLALDHFLVGQTALDARRKAIAVLEFEEALRLEPTHYWSMMKLGQSFNDLGEGPADFAAAVAVYTGCIMKRPDHALAYRHRAQAHANLKQYEKSVQDYSKAIALDPKDMLAWCGRGVVYCDRLREYDKALDDFNKVIELDPRWAGAWTNRGNAYKGLHQYDKAFADFNKAIALNPKYAGAWNSRGVAYIDLHQHDKAHTDFTKAIELNPKYALAWTNRGVAYNGLHRHDKALTDLNKAIALDPRRAAAWTSRGNAYRGLHQHDKALADLTKAIELDPKNAVAWLNRGAAYNDLRQRDNALADLNKAIALDPRWAAAWTNRGNAYHGLHQHDKAFADFNKAIALDPKNAAAWLNRGGAYNDLRQHDKALADLNEAIALDPRMAKAWSNRGNAYNGLHRYHIAIADHSKAIELDPRLATAWHNRGKTYYDLHRYEKALADFNKAVELDPSMAAAWNGRGGAYNGLHQHDKALADFTKAIELDPSMAAAWNSRGATYCDHLAQYDKAFADFTKAIELDPSLAMIWRNRAVAYTRLGQYDKALADYSKAIDLDPKNTAAWNSRGVIYCDHLAQYDKAVADFNKAIELDPRRAASWYNRGVAYSCLRQYDKALADYSRAIDLDPRRATAWTNRGETYIRLRQYDKALADLNNAIALDPKLAPAWTNRGIAYNNLHQYDKAVADFSKAIELDPRRATSWYNRGVAYSRLRQYDKALADFNQATELDLKNAGAWNTLARLFATCPDPRLRDSGKAVRFAQKAVELAPANGNYWNTLGAAHYRAGDWKLAVEALTKSMGLRKGGDSADWFFLAMAHWQLGEKDKAHEWFNHGVQWMEKNAPRNEELRRFRAEAAELLELKDQKK